LIPEAERSTTSSEFVPMGISIPWETVIVPLLTSALPPSLHPKRISATAKEPTANLYTEFIMVIFERYRWSVSILSFFRCPYWTMHNRERHLGFGSRWCSPRPEVRLHHHLEHIPIAQVDAIEVFFVVDFFHCIYQGTIFQGHFPMVLPYFFMGDGLAHFHGEIQVHHIPPVPGPGQAKVAILGSY